MSSRVVVSMPSITKEGADTVVTADVAMPGEAPVTVWYRCPVQHVSQEQALDAFFVLALVPAMRRGATLSMPGPVSRDLLRGAETFQDIYHQWYPDLMRPVPVEAPARTHLPDLKPDRGLASCFTGGVDAFYSVLNPPEALTRLVYVHGFDIPLRARRFRKTVAKRLRTAARELDVPLLEVQTNLRELTNAHGHWPKHIHGSALASVGILLADDIDGLLIPSSGGSGFIWADNGSHQLTDRLHGTEYFSVVHHPTGVPRIAKTEAVARDKVGARHLRVCFKSREAYNCGDCYKCRRTLFDLHAVGLKRKVRSFRETPTRREVLDSVLIGPENPLHLAVATRDHIRANGGPQDMDHALTRAITAHEMEEATNRVLSVLPDLPHDPSTAATLQRLREAVTAEDRERRRRTGQARVRALARKPRSLLGRAPLRPERPTR